MLNMKKRVDGFMRIILTAAIRQLIGKISMKPVRFISDRRYRWMSNFYGAPITVDGATFPTVEHAFQCAKTEDPEWKRQIRECKTPGDAKRAGRKCPMRTDWEEVKVEVMTRLVRLKFHQHPELKKKLLATEQRPIEEDAPWDEFWGTGKRGGKGDGQNMMGKILKQVRRELQGNLWE